MIYKIIIIALFSLLLTACGNNNISENDTSTDNNSYSRLGYNREGQYERNHNEIARMAKLRREESSMDLERIEKNIYEISNEEVKINEKEVGFQAKEREEEENER